MKLASRVRGFALMMAVFLIVTLATIAVYLLTVSTGQLQAVTQDEQGVRAYQAARTGIDWAAYQILRNSGSTFATNCSGGSASQTLVLTAAQLTGFRAEVSCSRVGSESDEGVTVTIFLVTVKACNGSPSACGSSLGPTYVERELALTLTQ